MIEYCVSAAQVDAPVSLARCKDALLMLDTNAHSRPDAFNPVELLLASLAACMIESVGRLAPQLRFDHRGVTVWLRAMLQSIPPKIVRIDYVLSIDTEESQARLEILHLMVRTYGTVSNTVAPGTELVGRICRAKS